MLSILIPTYNQDITSLVTELQHQVSEQFVDFEIIVMEDGSTLFVEENSIVNGLEAYCFKKQYWSFSSAQQTGK